MKRNLTRSNSVSACMRFSIHRYIAYQQHTKNQATDALLLSHLLHESLSQFVVEIHLFQVNPNLAFHVTLIRN
jgi:hypothetical protein